MELRFPLRHPAEPLSCFDAEGTFSVKTIAERNANEKFLAYLYPYAVS